MALAPMIVKTMCRARIGLSGGDHNASGAGSYNPLLGGDDGDHAPGGLTKVAAIPTFRRAAAMALAALVVSAAARSQETAKPERGQQILNTSCLTCHDNRAVDTQALDAEAWSREVTSMIEKGAEVKAADVPVLVEYLARYHGPLPDGPGREVVLTVCTQCHDLGRVRRERLSPEGWAEILQAMLNEGAPLTDKDFEAVLRYLARNFRLPAQH
jgi:mono/diheme cytochrome c family protein